MRVVSLLPSGTEILYGLGIEPVAVSHECDFPPAAREKPVVNRSRVDPTAGATEINEQVERAEQEHAGVYELRDSVLEAADPDLILTQGVCDVCAVDDTLVQQAIERLDLDCRILSTHPHSLTDVLADIERIGAAIGRAAAAATFREELSARISAIERQTPNDGPRVAIFDWPAPVMIAGHWIPGMLERIGAAYGLADPGDRSTPREWRDIVEYDPELVITAPCGFELEKAIKSLSELRARDGWKDLTAVQTDRVYAMDGHHYVNRPGPRLVDTLEYFAGIIHPDIDENPSQEVVRSVAGVHA